MDVTAHPIAGPEALGIDPEKLSAALGRAETDVRSGLLPSMQLAIARHGRLACVHVLGAVESADRVCEASPNTLYCVFSATKAIVSAAAWLLMQEGKLDLDAPVCDVIPEFGMHGKEAVRIEHLFAHTAGLPAAPFPQPEWGSREKRLERFASWRLDWEPGTAFVYHPTSSLWVIAELIDRLSGMDYRDFVRKRIAEPLGLPDLRVGAGPELAARVADVVNVGEEPTADELHARGLPVLPRTEVTPELLAGFNEPDVRAAGAPGAGGVMSAAELALFYQALLTGRAPDGRTIWSTETLAQARRIRSGELRDPLFGKLANRALGIVIAGDAERSYRGFGHPCSPLAFGHNGAGGQLAWADPETGISIGYVTNGLDRDAYRQAYRSVAISSRVAACAADG